MLTYRRVHYYIDNYLFDRNLCQHKRARAARTCICVYDMHVWARSSPAVFAIPSNYCPIPGHDDTRTTFTELELVRRHNQSARDYNASCVEHARGTSWWWWWLGFGYDYVLSAHVSSGRTNWWVLVCAFAIGSICHELHGYVTYSACLDVLLAISDTNTSTPDSQLVWVFRYLSTAREYRCGWSPMKCSPLI